MSKIRIAIFASGSGTNAVNIIRYFDHHESIDVNLLLSNNPKAGVLEKAESLGIPAITFSSEELQNGERLLQNLNNHQIDFIVLAGFLKLIPSYLVEAYPNKIINIHPALLPEYGGKGMYGQKVHQTVKENGELETGITIHYVNEAYDEGAVIFQKKCPIDPENETVSDIQEKVHSLEYRYYPPVIEKVAMKEVHGLST